MFSSRKCCYPFARICLLLTVLACTRRDTENGAPAVDSIMPGDSISVAVPSAPVGDSGAPKLLPIDQADSSFAQFRRELLVRLQQRDTAYLYSILAPEIKNSFGGDDRLEGFKRIWKMEKPDSSLVWSTLSRALTLGGKLDRDESNNNQTYFRTPYVYAIWPDNIDPFEHVAVTDADAPVYQRPDATAPVVATVSHSILPVEEWQGLDDGVPTPGSFARVKLPSGKSVWISATQVYSPVGWRAFFEKRAGRWVMTLFVAGD